MSMFSTAGRYARYCVCSLLLVWTTSLSAEPAKGLAAMPTQDAELSRIAFGSCARETQPQPIWDVVQQTSPDLFLFIGDNVYADIPKVPERREQIEASYQRLAAIPEFASFRKLVPILATWDDHDYGKNDAGVEWALKADAQDVLLDFFEVDQESPRRTREGVYHAQTFGPEGRRVQVILLDTRYHRSALTRDPQGRSRGKGPYMSDPDPAKTMLGEEQWMWLEARLREPAEVRLIVSSIQVVSWEHRFETWGNLPAQRQALFELIGRTDARGVVFLSGDRHLSELSVSREPGTAYPMYDFTSSGLNQGRQRVREPNQYRVGGDEQVFRQTNFGLITIDWAVEPVEIQLQIIDAQGEPLFSHNLKLTELQPAR